VPEKCAQALTNDEKALPTMAGLFSCSIPGQDGGVQRKQQGCKGTGNQANFRRAFRTFRTEAKLVREDAKSANAILV